MLSTERSDAPNVVSHFNSFIAKPTEAALNVGPLREVPRLRARSSRLGTLHVTAGTEGRVGGCFYKVWHDFTF